MGAFCVYLLLGLIGSRLYRLLHLFGWAMFSGNISGQERETKQNYARLGAFFGRPVSATDTFNRVRLSGWNRIQP